MAGLDDAGDPSVVAVFPDGPWRYLETVYDDGYCAEHGLLDALPQEEPDEIAHPAEREVRRWTRCADLSDPLTWTGDVGR